MITTCEHCGKQYKINPNMIKGSSARFKCKACGNVSTILKPEEVFESPSVVNPEPIVTPNSDLSEEKTPVKNLHSNAPVGFIRSIRTKITLIIMLLVIVSLGVVGVIAVLTSRQALINQAENHLSQMSSQKSKEYNQIFEKINEGITSLADYSRILAESDDISTENSFPVLIFNSKGPVKGSEFEKRKTGIHKQYMQYQRMGQVFNSYVEASPFILAGYVASKAYNGSSLMVPNKRSTYEALLNIPTYHPHIRPWYIRAEKEQKTIWTAPYVDADTKELIVTCASPVFHSDKRFIGVAAFDVLLTTIEQGILKLDIGYNSYAFLIDKTGKVLVRPGMKRGDAKWDSSYTSNNLLETGNPRFTKITRKMIKGAKGIDTYIDADKGETYIAYSPIKAINASMGIVVTKKAILQPAITAQIYIAGVCIVVIIISIFIGILVGNGITKPINELTTMANLISQGKMDLDVIDENRKDEIGVLTKSFNRLVISLKLAMSR